MFNKLLESMFCFILVVEGFSLQKIVKLLKEVVVSWQEVRWWRWTGQNPVVQSTGPIHSAFEALRIQHLGVAVEKNRTRSLDQCWQHGMHFSPPSHGLTECTSDPYLILSLSSRLLSSLWSGFDPLMHEDLPSLYPPFSCLAAAWPPRQRSALVLPVPLHWFKIYVVCNRVCFLQEVLFVLWETFCLFCMDGWIFLPVRLLAAVEPYKIVLGPVKCINVGGHCMCVSDWSWMCEFTIFSVSRWKLNC